MVDSMHGCHGRTVFLAQCRGDASHPDLADPQPSAAQICRAPIVVCGIAMCWYGHFADGSEHFMAGFPIWHFHVQVDTSQKQTCADAFTLCNVNRAF